MHFYFDDVNESFDELVNDLWDGEIITMSSPSRVGDVRFIPEPVTITYMEPRQRVLFNQARDCNPFFHLYEAMWMLAGRNDIAPLEYYSSGYAAQVRDGESTTANGAYGYRWRHAHNKPEGARTHGEFEGIDQLDIVINHLKQLPASRRVVLQMWNVEDDLLKIGPENQSKDVCCNTAAYFMILNGKLEMTVTNRSNDLIWGALGANYVHFTFLQEYVANCLGIPMGCYHQFSNNLHYYTSRWFPKEWTLDETENVYNESFHIPQLVQDRETFDREVKLFVEFNRGQKSPSEYITWTEPYLQNVAQPMMHAFHNHKRRDYASALQWLGAVDSFDWKTAGVNWINKRRDNFLKKAEQNG